MRSRRVQLPMNAAVRKPRRPSRLASDGSPWRSGRPLRVEPCSCGWSAVNIETIDGAVSGLSPYLTHGFVTLPEVLAGETARHALPAQHKYVFELGWREYFRHVWAHRGDGILQSLLHERDLLSTLAEVHRVLRPGGTFGLELVADLPSWEEYRRRVSLEGWRGRRGGTHVTLVETVRQDRERRRTIFDQEFTERRGRSRRVRRFSLAFRTLSVPQMVRRLEKAGFEITALLGDYRGREWDPRADVWVILAKRA